MSPYREPQEPTPHACAFVMEGYVDGVAYNVRRDDVRGFEASYLRVLRCACGESRYAWVREQVWR